MLGNRLAGVVLRLEVLCVVTHASTLQRWSSVPLHRGAAGAPSLRTNMVMPH
jgi:hypothetical protein